jgi:hypothetical protein
MTATISGYPTLNSAPAALSMDAVTAYVASLKTWCASTGATLVDLDHELANESDQLRQDHTLAFVIWQALNVRVDEVATSTSFAPGQRLGALDAPLVAGDGTTLASSASEGAQLIGALVTSIHAHRAAQANALHTTARITEDLATAAPLVKQLSMRAGELEELRSEVGALQEPYDARQVGDLRARSERLVADLRAADAERTTLLSARAGEGERIATLHKLEAEAHAQAAVTTAKIAAPPKLGIVSVVALGSPPESGTGAAQPWPAQRERLVQWNTKLSRAEAALREVIRAHTAALAERNELRQFADAVRAKAMSHGVGELPEVAAAYQAVRDVLWSAPSDMVAARTAVAAYQTAVEQARPTSTVRRQL